MRATSGLKRAASFAKLAVLPIAFAIAIIVAWQLGYFELEKGRRLVEATRRIHEIPLAGPAYVLAYTVSVMIGLPVAIITVLGGALFGPLLGMALAWAGALTGTMAGHTLARSVGREPLQKLFGRNRLLRKLQQKANVLTLFRLRVLPVAPFGVFVYLAGIASVPLRALLVATAFGILPSATAYSYVGDRLLAGIIAEDEASSRALVIAGSVTATMILLSLLPYAIGKLRQE